MVTGAPQYVRDAITERLDGTIGRNKQTKPTDQAPLSTPQSVTDIAKAAMASMVDQSARTTVDIGATYQEGMMTAL